jgi:hypothetical protein
MVKHFFEIIAIKIEADIYLVTFLEDARFLLYLWITRKKIILEVEQWTNGGTTKRMGTLVQPLEKPKDNGNTYSRAGTAELKPYLKIMKKFRTKLENILILQYIFTFTTEKMTLVIGQHLKSKNHPRRLFKPWSTDICQK